MFRFLTIFTFLALTAENYAELPFDGKWSTVFAPIGDLLFKGTPLKAPGIALAILAALALARTKAGASSGRAAILDRALWANLIAMGLLLLWGLIRGGSLISALIQIQVMLFLPITAFMFIAALRDEEQFRTLGKVIVYAALYRGSLAIYFYSVIVPRFEKPPPTMTTHSDTVLFTTAVIALISWCLEDPQRKHIVRSVLMIAYLMVAIYVNNRRLAYVAIVIGLMVLYFMLEPGEFKTQVNKKLRMLAPVVAIYFAVGWGSNNPFFAPAKSFSSMFGQKQDASSQTRDIENYNLIVTLKDQFVAGSGWGHGYNEVSVAFSVSDVFPIYRYVPHNSVLGIWAFTGYLGSTALWAMFLVANFLAIRAYRRADTPIARTACAVSVSAIMIYALQAYGDMGIMAWNANFIVSLAFAAASRFAVGYGAYPDKTS